MISKNLTRTLTGGLLTLLCAMPAAAANLAGKAVFVSGKVTATDSAGDVRELKAQDEVYSGDLLETRRGRVQIKYADGAFMSIQPNSRFQIEDYHYANQSDGSEKAIYNLLKGGMRAFTGAIGKKHPNAYKVKTPVATIGIRGTGHNTRYCQGDYLGLDGMLLPDGLHHTTWEGITFVHNDAGITEVPTGHSVFVQSIDSPAQETSEASPVTAVQSSQRTVEELAEEQEEQITLEAGDQVDSGGIPGGIPPPYPPPTNGLEMVQNQTLIGMQPDTDPLGGNNSNAGGGLVTNNTILVGPDSMGTPGMVTTFGTGIGDGDMDPNGAAELLLTIDPIGTLGVGSPDANITKAQGYINDALAEGGADAEAVNVVISDPAIVSEYTEGSFLGSSYAHGRWSDGNLLFISEGVTPDSPGFGLRTVGYDTLAAGQNLHLLNGDTADTNFGTGATGTYDFISGTASTDTNGEMIGSGVVSGSLTFDFDTLNGTIDMEVEHDFTYMVSGGLFINPGTPVVFSDVANDVYATASDGVCVEGCETFIGGTFFGSLAGTGTDGAPVLAGLNYEIITIPPDSQFFTDNQGLQDGPLLSANPPTSGNSIIGNAIFGRTGTAAPIPDVFTVTAGQNLGVVLPEPVQPPLFPDEFASVGLLLDTTSVVGDDRAKTTGLLLAAGTEFDPDADNFFVVATVDPGGMLGVSDPDTNLVAAQGLISDALVSDNGLVQSVISDPARVADFFQGSGFAYGRWTNGNVLILDENLSSGGAKTVEVATLTGYQSLHFINGDTPATPSTGATGTYDFIGGTQSTTASGSSIGLGVTSGQLTFDFDSLSGTVAMTVNHLANYNVSGGLVLNPLIQGQFSDLNVTATTLGGNCDSGCSTFIDGGFAGALSGGLQASPETAGLQYSIADPVDGIMGVAAFTRTGDGLIP